MAREKSFLWSADAADDFDAYEPSDEEIDAVDEYMAEAIEDRIETALTNFSWSAEGQILFRCGRFGVTFWFPGGDEEAQITTVFLWDEAYQEPSEGSTLPASEAHERWTTVDIFYATDRNWVGDEYITYGKERGTLTFGICEVSIPVSHKIGFLESPSLFKLEFSSDQRKHVTLRNVIREDDPERFFATVASKVSDSKRKEAFVFIHGYNVTFDDAARRTAQMAFDLNFDGAPILYSWPSAGKIAAYMKDETNIGWTESHLKQFLTELSERIGAATIHLIAHSMGNRALASVLTKWEQAGKQKPAFRHVVLTAPDIDAETFEDLAAAICARVGKVTLYSSHRDKALIASKRFHGYTRAGEIVVILLGLDTIEASAVNTSFLGHSHFGESRSVIQDIYWLFRDHPPEMRFGISRIDRPEGFYYVFRP
jgi:esterase/lipase superfamily enzyme